MTSKLDKGTYYVYVEMDKSHSEFNLGAYGRGKTEITEEVLDDCGKFVHEIFKGHLKKFQMENCHKKDSLMKV